MSAARAPSGGRGGRGGRGGWAWLLVVVGLIAIVVLGGRASDDPPFDPRSTEPTGTKALVLLVEALEVDVTIADEMPGRLGTGDVIAIVRDRSVLSDEQVQAVDEALDRGATVVISDPFSPLTPPVAGALGEIGPFTTETELATGTCDIGPLVDIGPVDAFGAYGFEVDRTSGTCYGDDDQAFVTVSERAGGNLVSLGGTTPFTNEFLGDAENAAVIVSLVAPTPGTDVVFLEDAPIVAGADDSAADSPFDLVDSSVVSGLVQLGVAFLLYALWRGRRLGRPMREPQPVDIDGSELVAAVGDLLHRTGEPQRAGQLLRADTRRRLCERLGLPLESPIDTIASAVAGRTGIDDDRVVRVLSSSPVTTDDELVSLATEIESLSQEILHEHPA